MKIKEYIIILDEDGLFLHIEDELVRCKECRWYKFPTWADKYYCTFRRTWQDTDEDDFCSCGECRDESEVEVEE